MTDETQVLDRVQCEVCDARVHAISIHIRDNHGENSEYPITLEEYKERFPDSPMFSREALERIAKKRAESKMSGVKKEDVVSGPSAPMNKLFGLGRIAAAKTASGDDIMIDICQQEGFEELIPTVDPNYVYPVDVLKSVLMGVKYNFPIYIYGHAGVGKSTIFKQVCGLTKRRMLRVQHTRDTEESHIVGQWTVKKFQDPATGKYLSEMQFEPGPLPLAMKYGWVYLADEYDRGEPSVLSTYQAVLEGDPLYIKEAGPEWRHVVPHPDFRFVANGNTNGSGDETGLYQATVVQDAATVERFPILEKIDYLPKKQEIQMVRSQTGLLEEDAARIIVFCEKIREAHPHSISLTIGPRVAINIGKIGLLRGDYKKAIELCFANRLPETEREAALAIAQRIFG